MPNEKRTVRAVRREKEITLQQLAEKTGIPLRTLTMIDRKHYFASPEQVLRICDALDVPPEELDIGAPETKPGTWGTGGTYS